MDYTLATYQKLIKNLIDQGFSFLSFEESLSYHQTKCIILRHDVDRLPENSLTFAKIQKAMGIHGSYYFRVVPQSLNEKMIKEIYSLGHEVGYHYEDLSFAWAKLKAQGRGHRAQGEKLEREIVEIGVELFQNNLQKLRKIVPVKTICMHGSPMSRWDSKLLWKYYDYHDFGIVGEPYFDIDFNKLMYLTDTGRRWDGESVSIRDKSIGAKDLETKRRREEVIDKSVSDLQAFGPSVSLKPPSTQRAALFPKFHSTFDIIKATEEGSLPNKIMMTFHPQRWTDQPVPWMRELIWQNVKNVGKFFLVKVISE